MLNIIGLLSILPILIPFINSQSCGVPNPKVLDECLKDSTANSICCQANVSLLNRNETLCVYVPKNQVFITPYLSSMDISYEESNLDFKIDCGKNKNINKGESFSVCGTDPKTPDDCLSKSLTNASCCYVSNPNGKATCLLNNGIYKKNSTFFGINIICSGFINKWYNYLIIFFCSIF